MKLSANGTRAGSRTTGTGARRILGAVLLLLLCTFQAEAAQERLPIDGIGTGGCDWVGCSVANLDDDPDAAGADWATASDNNTNHSGHFTFPTPSQSLTIGAGLQEFRVSVRKNSTCGTGTPTARIELWEAGSLIRAGTEFSVTAANSSQQVASFTWNATEITNAGNVEILVAGTKAGGAPASRCAVDLGAVEWNAETSVAADSTTLGDGTDPAATPSLCPGGAATMLDAFSFVTSGNSDIVTDVTVSLAAGTGTSLSLLEITSADGVTVYGSVSAPITDTQVITLSTNTLTATTTLTEYRVRITPKAHADMSAPSGTSYTVTGTITAFTPTANTTAGSDTDSDTVTIDNASPANATWGTITPGDGQVELNWTNPGDGDFSEVVILRNTASITDVPSEGTTYSPGGTIGTSDVVYVGTATTFTDTGVTNDTSYWYAIFARDGCINYSAEAETGPHTPTLAVETTTLGDGTDPAASPTLCPGDGATMLDAFSFVTTAGTDDVTAIDVALAAGTGASLSLLEVTSADGATVYGSASSPIADTESITLSTPITATTTLTEYRLRATPKTHAAMPAPPGSSYTLTGTVTAFTPTANTTAGSDTGSDTITIDNLSTAEATWGVITSGDGQVDLAWTNPGDADFADVVILRATATVTDAPAEGSTYIAGNTIGAATVVYVGTGTTFSDTTVTNGTSYYYEIFARDGCSNYSSGVATGPHRPISAAAAKHQLGTPSDDSTDTSAPVTDHLMVTIPTTASQGGNDATSARVSIGGTVAAADVDSVAVFYGGSEAGRVTSPGSLTDIDITLGGSEKGGADWTFVVSLAASAGGKTFDLTVTSIADTNNANLPFTTATRTASASADVTTLGDGTDPSTSPSLCPGDAATFVDAFSFVTSGNSDTVTALEVTLAAGSSAVLSLVEVTSVDGVTVYGSAAPAGDVVPIALSTNTLTATGALTEYRLRITPKTDAAMPAPPGSSVIVTATVTAFTPDTNSSAGSDVDSDAVTIDNASPGSASWGTITAGDNQIDLSWTNPVDADFAEVIVLRDTAAVSASPSEGSTYSAGATIGTASVVYAGTATSFTDTTASNGTQYWYAIFARDNCANWSGADATGPHTPTAATDTTTLGDGTDPAAAPSLCPGGGATMLDAFSLITSGNADDVTSLTVGFAAGTAASLALVEVTSADGATVYGSISSPIADTQTIALTTPITATAALVEYRIRITPKAHGSMPAPPGTSYSVTGTVTSFVPATNATAGNDSDSDTITIDNASTTSPSWGIVTPGDGEVALSWTNPVASDFAEVVILRGEASISATPAEGATYAASDTIGAATVIYVGAGTSHTDASVTNDTQYWYAIFARDDCGNYSTGAQTGPVTPAAAIETVTIGNGSDPAGSTVCPGGAAAFADSFTAQVTAGTDQITAVTVGFANGSSGVGLVEITNDAGTVVHGSVTNPSTNQTITLTTPISVTTTPTQYRIRVTPKGHVSMPAAPGATYAVAPTISDVIVTGDKQLNDTTSATVTIDNESTLPASWGVVNAGDGQVSLNWSNPGASDFASVVILRSNASVADTPSEGASYSAGNTIGAATVVYAGTGTSHSDASVSNGIPYWYAIFARDDCGNYSIAAETGPHTPNPPTENGTTVTNSTAVVSSCRQITVASLFGGDDDGDGSTRVEYNTSNSFPGTVACAAAAGPSPRQCIIPGLSESTGYYIQVTFSDPDGVTGTNPQVIGPVTTTACGGDNAAPTLLVLSPARDAVIGGSEKVRVQVWDADDASPTVQWSVDGGSLSAATVNAAYDCGTNCRVMEFVIDTTGLSTGGHDLTVRATDSSGNVGTIRRGFQVQNAGSNPRGGGLLLKRSHGSQLCVDCHNIPTHSSQMTTTDYGNWAMECYSCHTPHNTTNIYLLRESILTPNSGERQVRYERNTVGATANSSTPGTASFVNEDNATQADGPCQVCHTRTGGATARWRNTAAGGNTDSHYTSGDGSPCTDCHSHGSGFAATGGSGCTGCHSSGQGSRRVVTADFNKKSHHVGTGGAMGGGLTDFDCVVCHAEGRINDAGDGVATTNRHNDGTCAGGKNCIDLKDADQWVNSASPAAGDFFPYDKDSIPGTAASWSSGNGTWETQTSTNLDPFCLSCHDADGAISSFASLDGGTALNPFGDGTVTNDYDQITRDPDGSHPSGRVVDVASRVVAGASDLDQAGEPRGPDGIPDPPKGIYSRHAIRGQSTSVYKTSVLTTYTGSWNDASVMGCADCHTTDGANGAVGNAHGSDSEYLLKDAFGGATLGRHNNYDAGAQTGGYVCWRCHDWNRYQRSVHTPNASDFEDSVGQIGPANRGATTDQGKTAGNFLGMACTNCHGGAAYNQTASGRDWITTPPYEFGSIHGTSQTIQMGPYDRDLGFTQQRKAYRFMNGNSLRWYNPEGWTGSAGTCYTLGTSGDSGGDNFGMCSQHSGGTGYTKTTARALKY